MTKKWKEFINCLQVPLISLLSFSMGMFIVAENIPEVYIDTTPVIHVEKVIDETPSNMIKRIAKEKKFDENIALRIATRESQLGKYRYNFEGSSAVGLFQFMPRTFESFCKGDINNDEDQIRCFMGIYPKYPGIWQCK